MKLLPLISILIFIVCFQHTSDCQQDCGTRLSPEDIQAISHYDKAIKHSNPKKGSVSYTLPLVFHIVHQGGNENISDDRVYSAVQLVNDAFSNVEYYDPSTGVDTEISFCLAMQDDNGAAINGITRHNSSLTVLNINTDDLALKNLSRWDPKSYINIWVVRTISDEVGGYATLPNSHGSLADGIVVRSNFVDDEESEVSVIVHELGHYLGLYHTFQDGCINDDCSLDGDRVCDTPPDDTTVRIPCSSTSNSCSTDTNSGFTSDMNDLFNNYMDYSRTECYNAFTQGQKDRMHFFISEVRSSLLDSKGCLDPCPSPITLNYGLEEIELLTGENFMVDLSSSDADNIQWFLEENLVYEGFSFQSSFDEPGKYNLRILATNEFAECFEEHEICIDVVCSANADFRAADNVIALDTNLSFSNSSSNYNRIEWSVDGQVVSSAEELSVTFSEEGFHEICIEATNQFCSDTYCNKIFISNDTQTCFSSFVRHFGQSGHNTINRFQETNDGIYAVGRLNGLPSIIEFDEEFEFVKTIEFQNHPAFQFRSLQVEEDALYLSGVNSFSLPASSNMSVTKYNLRDKKVEWSNETSVSRIYCNDDLLLIDDKLYIGGETEHVIFGCDAIFIEVDKNTGNETNKKIYNLGSCENSASLFYRNNHFYSIGRYNLDGGGQSGFRGAITKLDKGGNEVWTKVYLAESDDRARMYASEVIPVNDDYYFLGAGNYNGTNFDDAIISFQKLDEDFNPVLHYSYDIDTYTRLYAFNMIESPDGFYATGRLFRQDIQRPFLIHFSPEGDVIESYEVDEDYMTRCYDLQFVGDNLIMVGYHGSDSNSRAVMLSLGLPLGRESNCEILNPIVFTRTERPLVSEFVDLEEFDLSRSSSGSNVSVAIKNEIDLNKLCSRECDEICGNNIDDNNDGLTDCQDPKFEDDCCCYVAPVLDLGPDLVLCDNSTATIGAQAGFDSYLWNSGEIEREITIGEEGLHTVVAIDSCGVEHIDSVYLNFDDTTVLDLGPDTLVCSESYIIELNQFETHEWYLNGVRIECNICNPFTFDLNLGQNEIVGVVTSQRGCYSVDTILIDNDILVPDYDIEIVSSKSEDLDDCQEFLQALTTTGALIEEGVRYEWSTGDTTSTIIVDGQGDFSVTVTSCNNISSDIYSKSLGGEYKWPNIFFPQSQLDLNRTFGPHINCSDAIDVSYNLEIYNRWGKKVFESENPLDRWSGTLNNQGDILDEGVYIFQVFINGELVPASEDQPRTITLVRN